MPITQEIGVIGVVHLSPVYAALADHGPRYRRFVSDRAGALDSAFVVQLRFGLVIPAEFRAGAELSVVSDASRALGFVREKFESAWVVDHLQSGTDVRLEGFTLLSYLAAIHKDFKFGHTVLCQSFRNPGLVAKMGATLQMLSGGRFILGLGAGGNEEEYRAFGYDYPPARERVRQLEEYVAIIKALWSRPVVTFEGDHYRVVEARCEPRPEPIPPLMLGAFRPRMISLVAREADWWNVSSTGPTRYARILPELERACDAARRDSSTVRRTWVGGFACAATSAAARELAGSRFDCDDDEDYGFIGTPGEIVSQIRVLAELGIDYFMLDAADFPQLGGLELLMRYVLPELGS